MKPAAIFVLMCAAVSASATQAHAQAWPVGIPMPPFGINENAGTPTHYVDNTNSSATDTSNPNGTPTRPRRTVPGTLAAGSVVEVRGGPYSVGETSFTGNGTASAPVFIKGVGNPVFNATLVGLSGAYFVIEGVVFNGAQILLDGNRISLRGSEVRNYQPGGHSSAVSVQGTYLVIYRNNIHHNGDASGSAEEDVHGVKPDTGDAYIWIIANDIHHNGGDSVQIGNATSSEPWAHHIYIGGNTLHEDRENAVDIKRARDVIVSNNDIYGYQPTGSSNGEATVTHNNPQRVWFINNTVRNSHTGIVCTGADQYYVVGNAIYDIIHNPGRSYDPNNLYGTQAILTYSTTNAFFVGNTIWNVDAGISYASGSGKYEFFNNIIGNLLQPSHHIAVSNSTAASNSVMRTNLFSGAVRIRWGGSATSSLADCENCKTGDPLFLNAATRDLRIQALSPAVDAGTAHSVYTTFQNLYGLSIAQDRAGSARPRGAWDIGAYESGSGVVLPSSPTNLRILP